MGKINYAVFKNGSIILLKKISGTTAGKILIKTNMLNNVVP